MPLPPDQIQEGHCYRVRQNGVRLIVARVLHILESTTHISENEGMLPQTSTLKTKIVRYHFRTNGGEWSTDHQQESLAAFAVKAEAEVACE